MGHCITKNDGCELIRLFITILNHEFEQKVPNASNVLQTHENTKKDEMEEETKKKKKDEVKAKTKDEVKDKVVEK